MAGRGYGKTRTGAEWVKEQLLLNDGWRCAIVAPTFADARDTCIEGDSGLLNILPQSAIATWNRSMGELHLTNGSQAKLFSATEPDRLRGPQHHIGWGDEVAAWQYEDAWDQLLFGMRLGERPRIVLTTTPRPTKLVRTIIEDSGTVITKGSTYENAANLAPSALAALKKKYEGTRLGRQELDAELLTDTPGALWTFELLEKSRCRQLPDMVRIVVAVDPAISDNEGSDENGIIVAGIDRDGIGYVIEDCSLRGGPSEWSRTAVAAYERNMADLIVGESNQGGEMVRSTLSIAGKNVPIKLVHASKGKLARAEPIAMLYEQGRVKHYCYSSQLEDQMTTYAPNSAKKSPDRMDAMVWALTELMLGAHSEPRVRGL